MDDITRRQQQLLVIRIHCVCFATICILYAAYAAVVHCVLEAQKAVWSPEETTALVDYLYKRRSRADRRGNFSTETFAAAAEAIWPLLEDGPEKTEKMCKTKWTRIKFIYSTIQKYKIRTRMHWDNTNGANINSEAAERVWNNYIAQKSNRAIKAFRNTGWLYYDKVKVIVDPTPRDLKKMMAGFS